jgi:hypothetical protein
VRKEKMYAALRMGVLCVSGKSTLGKSSSTGCALSRFVRAPMPEPPSNARIPSSHRLDAGLTR